MIYLQGKPVPDSLIYLQFQTRIKICEICFMVKYNYKRVLKKKLKPWISPRMALTYSSLFRRLEHKHNYMINRLVSVFHVKIEKKKSSLVSKSTYHGTCMLFNNLQKPFLFYKKIKLKNASAWWTGELAYFSYIYYQN